MNGVWGAARRILLSKGFFAFRQIPYRVSPPLPTTASATLQRIQHLGTRHENGCEIACSCLNTRYPSKKRDAPGVTKMVFVTCGNAQYSGINNTLTCVSCERAIQGAKC